jgi:hypothetical protein
VDLIDIIFQLIAPDLNEFRLHRHGPAPSRENIGEF